MARPGRMTSANALNLESGHFASPDRRTSLSSSFVDGSSLNFVSNDSCNFTEALQGDVSSKRCNQERRPKHFGEAFSGPIALAQRNLTF